VRQRAQREREHTLELILSTAARSAPVDEARCDA
jgi:hypothetical protein